MKNLVKVVLIVLILGGLGYATNKVTETKTVPERVDINKDFQGAVKQSDKMKALATAKPATKTPGRVVELETSRGIIDFVLFEKDCPKTTQRIAELVQKGAYNGVTFPRVESGVIQTGEAKVKVPPMGLELCTGEGWTQAKGSVGMARNEDPSSNTSVFYILLEPAPQLDSGYTCFGRVFKGMDAVMKMKLGDVIKRATLRPFTSEDNKLFMDILKIEAERKTQ